MTKHGGDLFVALIALILLAPLIAIIALLVALFLGRPVLFTQLRPGLHVQPFRLYKFRTMTDARDAGGQLMPDSVRLTPFGRALRALSLDELPQLFNVLLGDLSLVGPRPLLMTYLPYYTPVEMRRHNVRPGITGWAQVNGRNALSWDDKLALDVWYVDHQSLLQDFIILLRTVPTILARTGISEKGSATMTELTVVRSGDGER